MTAELLNRAAKHLREHALRAVADVRELERYVAQVETAFGLTSPPPASDRWEWAMRQFVDQTGAGEYCTLMRPEVAHALAALLDYIAHPMTCNVSEHLRRHAEAVARIILQEGGS